MLDNWVMSPSPESIDPRGLLHDLSVTFLAFSTLFGTSKKLKRYVLDGYQFGLSLRVKDVFEQFEIQRLLVNLKLIVQSGPECCLFVCLS